MAGVTMVIEQEGDAEVGKSRERSVEVLALFCFGGLGQCF
jgi:hypothetical protein